jgi:polar amino acid transport system substrate-binding protein
MNPQITPATRSELAPSGKLRVGINHSNFLLVNPGSPHGAPKGIAPDLALELGKRVGLPVEFVSFDAAGKTADAIRDARVDVGFIANEAERANVIEFSTAYLELPATYLPCPRWTGLECGSPSLVEAPTTFISRVR